MPEPHLRASDADRAAVADVLGRHMSAGRLTVAEYDDRLTRAYASRTYGELAELTADLPPVPAAPGTGSPAGASTAQSPVPAAGGHPWPAGQSTACGGSGLAGAPLRAVWAGWLSTALIVSVIWAATSLAAGSWLYFWPIWVIGPWGAVLLSRTINAGGPRAGRERNRNRGRRLPG